MFEVFKKCGCLHVSLGTIIAVNSAEAALKASKIKGLGLYKVRPIGSQKGFFAYRIK